MKKIISLFILTLLLISCKGNDKMILSDSIGKLNKVMVVAKSSDWTGDIGQVIRNSFGEIRVGLPQPEAFLSVSQVPPNGFSSMMKVGRNILVISEGGKEKFIVRKNVYARPQTILYIQGKNDENIIKILKEREEDIKNIFIASDVDFTQNIFRKDKVDDNLYKTLNNIGVSFIIPNKFNVVEDTGDFLWLRNHLTSGIAKTGSNNILVYSVPLLDETKVADSIVSVRNRIGKKYIPGSKEGMHMYTEEAYTPFTFETTLDGKKAYETRGKWEVKNDFMAGPFLNYTVVDKKNNRLVIFEGFTYAPSVNKRAFVFELEAIAKSMKIK